MSITLHYCDHDLSQLVEAVHAQMVPLGTRFYDETQRCLLVWTETGRERPFAVSASVDRTQRHIYIDQPDTPGYDNGQFVLSALVQPTYND